MSVEQSRGAELPAGGSAATPADGVRMQILATEANIFFARRAVMSYAGSHPCEISIAGR